MRAARTTPITMKIACVCQRNPTPTASRPAAKPMQRRHLQLLRHPVHRHVHQALEARRRGDHRTNRRLLRRPLQHRSTMDGRAHRRGIPVLGQRHLPQPGGPELTCSRPAVRAAYQLRHLPAQQEVPAIADTRRPDRTLATSHLLAAAPHPPRRHWPPAREHLNINGGAARVTTRSTGPMGWLCDSVAVTAAVSDRLAEQDLVCRERSPGDGRGQNAVLTDRGLQRLRQA